MFQGTPTAFFHNSQCNFSEKFGEHVIRINLYLCGDWAGSGAYKKAGCPGSCPGLLNILFRSAFSQTFLADYVRNNPSEFVNAYFDFTSMRVYE
jgi:hypothetical protein